MTPIVTRGASVMRNHNGYTTVSGWVFIIIVIVTALALLLLFT